MTNCHSIKRRGFTLTEVVLAIMIITIGVLAAAGLIAESLANSKRTHDDMIAVSFSDMVFATMREGIATTNWSIGEQLVVYEDNSLPNDATVVETSGNQRRFYNVINLDRQKSFTPYSGTLGHMTNYIVSYEINNNPTASGLGVEIRVWPGYDTSVRPRIFYNEFSTTVP